MFGKGKHRVHRVEHAGRGAERQRQLDRRERLPRRRTLLVFAVSFARTVGARRPGTRRSTASRRPPRRSCAPGRTGLRRRKNPRRCGRECPIARRWCPAPRRPEYDRCRRRAFAAPSAPTSVSAGRARGSIRSSKSSICALGLQRLVTVENGVDDHAQRDAALGGLAPP